MIDTMIDDDEAPKIYNIIAEQDILDLLKAKYLSKSVPNSVASACPVHGSNYVLAHFVTPEDFEKYEIENAEYEEEEEDDDDEIPEGELSSTDEERMALIATALDEVYAESVMMFFTKADFDLIKAENPGIRVV